MTSLGNVDVTNKDDLEKLVQDLSKKEKCIHLLGECHTRINQGRDCD